MIIGKDDSVVIRAFIPLCSTPFCLTLEWSESYNLPLQWGTVVLMVEQAQVKIRSLQEVAIAKIRKIGVPSSPWFLLNTFGAATQGTECGPSSQNSSVPQSISFPASIPSWFQNTQHSMNREATLWFGTNNVFLVEACAQSFWEGCRYHWALQIKSTATARNKYTAGVH